MKNIITRIMKEITGCALAKAHSHLITSLSIFQNPCALLLPSMLWRFTYGLVSSLVRPSLSSSVSISVKAFSMSASSFEFLARQVSLRSSKDFFSSLLFSIASQIRNSVLSLARHIASDEAAPLRRSLVKSSSASR